MQYDGNDRLARITDVAGRYLAFTYDAAGRRSSSQDQLGHRLTYHYDTVGRLERITDEVSAEVVRYQYDAAGRLERKALGNGMYATYQYDPAGRLLALTNVLVGGASCPSLSTRTTPLAGARPCRPSMARGRTATTSLGSSHTPFSLPPARISRTRT